jgi:hypothetical protein
MQVNLIGWRMGYATAFVGALFLLGASLYYLFKRQVVNHHRLSLADVEQFTIDPHHAESSPCAHQCTILLTDKRKATIAMLTAQDIMAFIKGLPKGKIVCDDLNHFDSYKNYTPDRKSVV